MLNILRRTSDTVLHSAFPVGICACAASVQLVPVRHRKHWNPKFKEERSMKVVKMVLPDFEEERQEGKLSVEQLRSKLKEKGIAPPRTWSEKPMYVSCSSGVFESYVPPEGDGKISALSTSGAKQVYETIGKKGKSYMALRKIRGIDYDFDIPTIAEQMQKIYIEAQEALTAYRANEDKLHELVTEKAYPEMMENVANKTIVWKFVQSLEPPRVVHIRCTEMMSKDNLFAQVTLRFHTQQILAVYDRFGRLMHGSEETVKDVLEYIVYEKHITRPNANWRIHGKIIPDWLPPKEDIGRTFHFPKFDNELPEQLEGPSKQIEGASKESEAVPALA